MDDEQSTPDEILGAQKEMHMAGRAMRIDETWEQYRAEREASWEAKMNVLKAASETTRVKDLAEANKLREQLGIPSQETESKTPQTNEAALGKLSQLLSERTKRRPDLANVMNDLLDQFRRGNDSGKICNTLANELYQSQRRADYPQEPEYADAWNLATNDQGLPTRTENDWVYRGTFPAKGKGEKTETRGSLNIKLSPQAIKELDELIARGVIKGNYKFGDPGTGAAGTDRHDAVSVYFLEKPDEKALDALSEIARKHYRGENLLGNKIADGFYLSEVGSISDRQAGEFLTQLEQVNPQVAVGMRQFLTNRDGRVAMSEAQFYAAKDTLDLYNIDLGYNQEKGISIRLRK